MMTHEELNKIAAMSYFSPEDAAALFKEVTVIMALIEPIRQINTTNIPPLLHPQDLTQRFRTDVALHVNECDTLAKIAPLFRDERYLVPKVIE